jgi:hypothetical protein
MNDFISDFGIYRLAKVLKRHDVFNDKTVCWFWKNAHHWDASTQEDFDAIAERRIVARCNQPDRLDLTDDEGSWLALIAGRRTPGPYPTLNLTSRKVRREIPISWIAALRPDGPDSDPLLPWDNQPVTKRAGFDESVYRLIDECQENIRRQIIAQFQKERPEDYKFLDGYIISKRKTRHTAQERRRAKTIIDRLRRLEATEFYPEAERKATNKVRTA